MKSCGFTLSELLVALLILGIVATFTIPKVLVAQQSSQYNSAAKETAAMLSGAWEAYKTSNTITAATTKGDVTPFINYIRLDSVSSVDDIQTLGTLSCATRICMVLANGGVFHYTASTLGGTGATSAFAYQFDPDGRVTDGTANGPGKSIQFWVYGDGKIRTRGSIENNTCLNGSCYSANAAMDPPWFSWN